jgi:hypothetical protein
MGFQIMAAPDVVHRRLAHSQALGQGAAAPLGSALGFGLQGGVDDCLDLLRAIGGFASPAGSDLPQTLQTLLRNALAP